MSSTSRKPDSALGGWYISVAPVLTGDWEIDQGNKWTVPFGGGVGKVFRIGPSAINVQAHGYGNVVKPTGGADATLRVQLQIEACGYVCW